jgi:hypothetical protein
MRKILGLAAFAVALLCCFGGAAVADMSSYCLIPPYVKTDVKPNILIIMDNSQLMGGPIYSYKDTASYVIFDPNVKAFPTCTGSADPMNSQMALAYNPNHEYTGLFKSNVWYRYQSNQFKPDPSGVFDGNLLNFLTTSQYDLMMQILVGGKSTSRQTNVNNLLGYNASLYSCGDGTQVVPWDIRVFQYQGTDGNTYACEFKINDNNRGGLTISDSVTYHALYGYVCGLIKSPAVRPATNYYYIGIDSTPVSSSESFDHLNYAQTGTGEVRKASLLNHVLAFINDVFDFFSRPADAAALRVANPNSNAKFSTTLYQPMTSYSCAASGGTGTYTWSASGLPLGISITSGGVISGTPTNESDTTAGNIPVTITVSDGSSTASQSVTFTVSGSVLTITAPTTTSNLTDARRGAAYGYQCTASGGHVGNYTWSASGLPSGLSISSSTGLISGTTSAATGIYSVTVSVNDGYVTKSVAVSLNVKETLFIAAPTTSMPNAYFSQAYSYACQAQGGTGTYSWSATGLPTGLSIDSFTGIISGAPSVLGTFSVTVTVTSGISSSVTATLVVSGVRITWPTDNFMIGDTIYGQPYTARFRPVATGSTTGTYTWSATGLPAGLSIDPSSGVISGTETTYSDFYYTAIISVTDGVTSDSVHIQGYNWEPAGSSYQIVNLNNGAYIPSGVIGQQYGGFSVGTFYGDGQNSWTITGLPAGLSYWPYSGLIYGTPTGPAGCSAVTINTTNNSGSKNDSRTVNLCISSPGAPSITTPATDYSYLPNATVGVIYSFTPVASGGTLPYTWSAVGLPAGLSMNSSSGIISGTPTAGGLYLLTMTITDSAFLQANRTVYLTVIGGSAPVIKAPTTGATLPGATESASYAGYQCTATGGTGSYTWSASGLPSGMTIDATRGIISGIPAAGTAGSGNSGTNYAVIIIIRDAAGNSTSVAVTINVAKSTFQPNTASFNVNICASYDYDGSTKLSDGTTLITPYNANCGTSNANCASDIDCPEKHTCNNGKCEIKQGILQTFWPKANFGVIEFTNSFDPTVDECLPADNQTNFFTSVENALPVGGTTKLVDAENMAVHTYIGDLASPNACDPLGADTDLCRQNFILMLTNGQGANTPGSIPPAKVFSGSDNPPLPGACTALTYNLSKNACYGNNADLKPDASHAGMQSVSTYIVNSKGENEAILTEAANSSGGHYYPSADASELQGQIELALNTMINRAAAGTAASVLASGEGSGANLIQAVFYPKRKFSLPNSDAAQEDEIAWVGRLTNFWYYVDPYFANSTIRQDDGDRILNLKTGSDPSRSGDYITAFSFKADANPPATYATLSADTNGDGVADGSPISNIPFEQVGNLWEAGLELWKRNLASDPRTIYTTTDDTNLIGFSTGNAGTLQPYLQAGSANEASEIISWVKGYDKFCTGTATPCSSDSDCTPATCDTPYRSRTVTVNTCSTASNVTCSKDSECPHDSLGNAGTCASGGTHTWKLGDVLNSTPKISSWLQLNSYDSTYKDTTYATYVIPGTCAVSGNTCSSYLNCASGEACNPTTFGNRGMVFAGANDGMLHAFKLGRLVLNWSSQTATQKAELLGSSLGREAWAFIPRQVLPYLTYLAQTDYGSCHIYSVDLTPYVFDASIAKPAGCSGDYWDCDKTVASWKTILIGGMRFGGACKKACGTDPDCVATPTTDPNDNSKGLGYSSYFALDVTDQNNPQLMWEFSSEALGFTTTGPSIVRINGKDCSSGTCVDVKTKNGRWFVVLGSGPTGPINDTQFLGHSDQHLKLFIFDLVTGPSSGRVLDTGIANAFAGSMLNSTMDVDTDYQDEVVYVPYVKEASDSTWTDGGVGRLLTNSHLTGSAESATALNPANWVWSKVMDGIGPVTSAAVRLEKKDMSTLWLYFGTGRYYYKQNSSIDDADGQRQLFGVKDPCFSNGAFLPACLDGDTTNDGTLSFCSSPTVSTTCGDLTNVTDIADVPLNGDNIHGWYVNMDPSVNPDTSVCSGGMYGYLEGDPSAVKCRNYKAERVITDPIASSNGLVFFTTYKPYEDICSLGGKSFIWAVKYDNGGAPGALLKGKALIQESTGSIEQLDLGSAFSAAGGRKSYSLEGVPPTSQGLSILSTPSPKKRVLHMRER